MWFFDLISILVGILQWIVPNPKLKERLLLNVSQSKTVSAFSEKINSILLSPHSSIIVVNPDTIKDTPYIIRHRYLYWPVTPTYAPNIIHSVFINYIKILNELGFTTVVFVFDHYYALLNNGNKSASVCKSEVRKFVHSLKEMGLPESCKIVYESSFFKRKAKALHLINSILQIYSELTVKDLVEINKSKVYIRKASKTKFIRYSKPVYNMVYLSASKIKFGLTLSGEDEKILWDTYSHTSEHRNHSLTNLFIPTMRSIDSGSTDVLDHTKNITVNDLIVDIEEKIITSRETLKSEKEESGLLYLLNHNVFFRNKGLLVKNAWQNNYFQFTDSGTLAQAIIENSIDITDLANQIYKILRNQDFDRRD